MGFEPYVQEIIFQLKCSELFELFDRNVFIPTPESSECEDVYTSLSETPPPAKENISKNNNLDLDRYTPDQSQVTGPSQSKYFRPWEGETTSKQQHSENSLGGPSPQPGPSGINQLGCGFREKSFIFRKKGDKFFAKNKATDTTYEVHFNENWQNARLRDVHDRLHHMGDDVFS